MAVIDIATNTVTGPVTLLGFLRRRVQLPGSWVFVTSNMNAGASPPPEVYGQHTANNIILRTH